MTVQLTSLSHGAGCACKIGKAELDPILNGLPSTAPDPAVLVDASTADDAGVYRLSEDLALVQTVDFFTPIVDDPLQFGRIAAANALSDIYAMGAKPASALNLVAFPLTELGGDTLREILKGGAEIAAEAGVSIVGGHSIDDPEPKYGLAVTGVAHPDQVVRNSTAQPGDVLFLTKPIGGGVISTAAKKGNAEDNMIERSIEVMTTLNRAASEAALEVGPSAMTDVTGFGLLGHLHEMTRASGVRAVVEAALVPMIEGAEELAANPQNIAGGSERNRSFTDQWTDYGDSVGELRRVMLNDAMTSGGLLISVPRQLAESMRAALTKTSSATALIGWIEAGNAGYISVV